MGKQTVTDVTLNNHLSIAYRLWALIGAITSACIPDTALTGV